MVLQAKYFSLGWVWHFCNENASHGQINGSSGVTFGILLGGTCTVPPSEAAKSCDQ